MGRDSAHSIVYVRLEVMKLPTRIHLSHMSFGLIAISNARICAGDAE